MYQGDFPEGELVQMGISGKEKMEKQWGWQCTLYLCCIVMNIHPFCLLKATLKAKKFQKQKKIMKSYY